MLYRRSVYRPHRVFTVLALGLCLLPFRLALGQAVNSTDSGETSNSGQPEVDEAGRVMEQIIVTGQRPMRDLILEGEQLTEDFYDRLNEVLDDDNFKVTCDEQRSAASAIRERVCRTGFQRRLERYQAVDNFEELRDAEMQSIAGDILADQGRPEPTEVQEVQGNPMSAYNQAIINQAETQVTMFEGTRGSVGAEAEQIAGPLAANALRWQTEFQQAMLDAVNTDPVLNQQFHRLLELKSQIENYRSPRQERRDREQAGQENEPATGDARPSFRQTPR